MRIMEDKDNLKPMKVLYFTSLRALSFVISAAIIGCCVLPMGCTADHGDDDEDDPIIVVSNVFTPDGDGENDFFEVKTKDDDNRELSLKIYTRAGVLVFSHEARHCVWDGCSLTGQPMAAGLYQYTAEIRDSSPKISKCGFVQLYR